MSPRNIRRPEVLAKTGLSKTGLYMKEKEGSFPKHIMITPRMAVWNEAEVDAWIVSARANSVAPAPLPETDPDKPRKIGKRKAATGPQLNEVRQMLFDAMRLLDRIERQGMTAAVSVATCWNNSAGVPA